MGTTLSMLSEAGSFEETILPYLDGFHMHTLCEQNSDDLERRCGQRRRSLEPGFQR